MFRVGMVSLGCPRNLIDSEAMLGSLRMAGFRVVDPEKGADVLIVNTCSFIGPAREESVDAVLEASRLKAKGKIRRLIVCGCLAQLHKRKLLSEIPEIDIILGTGDFQGIAYSVKRLLTRGTKRRMAAVSAEPVYMYDGNSPRYLLTPGHYAYLKISEGCSNFCSYCIISKLRGRFRSRPVDSVISEAEEISKSGKLREINIIGQDTTMFGIDRYGKSMFAELLRRLCRAKSTASWIRVLYTHPAHYTDDLIRTIAFESKVCKYLDVPIQHLSDKILKRMNRRTPRDDLLRLIDRLRHSIPGVVLRTSVIVGFPGETEKDFNELLRYLRILKFERLGAFIYSCEKGSAASRLKGHLPEKIKAQRHDELMRQQKRISENMNKSFLNKRIEVLVDEKVEGEMNRYMGRTGGDAPDIDGTVYLTGKRIHVGEFCKVRITDTLEYDLVGEEI